MNKLDLKLFEHLMNIPSPTGYTKNAINFIDEYCHTLGYKTERNKKGNLIIHVNGNDNYTIGLSAHVDTLGLMVRSIRSDGHLNFTTLGCPQLPTYDGEYVTIHTRNNLTYTGTVLSTSPSSHVYPDATTKQRNADNMYIRLDELVSSSSDTKKLGIQNGDIVSIDPKFQISSSGYVKTRFLDDKASAFILLELLKELHEKKITPAHNLIIIFSTYEEVGHGASNIPEVDELLAVDMGCIGSDLSCTEEMVSICAKDSSGPYDYDMVTKLSKLAEQEKLNYAIDIYPFYGSDASAALRAGNDIKCALIGAGIQASHGMERTHIHGIENTLKLLLAYIKE